MYARSAGCMRSRQPQRYLTPDTERRITTTQSEIKQPTVNQVFEIPSELDFSSQISTVFIYLFFLALELTGTDLFTRRLIGQSFNLEPHLRAIAGSARTRHFLAFCLLMSVLSPMSTSFFYASSKPSDRDNVTFESVQLFPLNCSSEMSGSE